METFNLICQVLAVDRVYYRMSSSPNRFSVGFIVVGNEMTASTRHRVLDPIKYFKDNIDTDILSFRDHREKYSTSAISKALFVARILHFSRDKDIVYVQKIPLPKWVIQTIEVAGGDVVFDFDDALYTSPQWEDENSKRRSRLKQSIKSSTAVITGNPNLSDFARRWNTTVYTLPTPVPQDSEIIHKPELEQVTIGWIGGGENLRYLEMIEDPLTRILEEHDAKLNIITGEDPPVDIFEGNDSVCYIPWSLDKERNYLSELDLVVRPMWDSEWINGKGGYTSVTRCMSLGLPVIASPIEPLRELTTPNESILFASTTEEWYKKIDGLISNSKRRKQIGKTARREIETQQLWTEDYAMRLQNILEGIQADND